MPRLPTSVQQCLSGYFSKAQSSIKSARSFLTSKGWEITSSCSSMAPSAQQAVLIERLRSCFFLKNWIQIPPYKSKAAFYWLTFPILGWAERKIMTHNGISQMGWWWWWLGDGGWITIRVGDSLTLPSTPFLLSPAVSQTTVHSKVEKTPPLHGQPMIACYSPTHVVLYCIAVCVCWMMYS